MCKMLGVMCNDADLLACAIREVNDSLKSPTEQDYAGIGIGYYSGDDPLLKRRPANEPEIIDFHDLVEGIESNTLMVHVRHATVGGWKTSNTHPFRFRRWLFAHTGHLPALGSQTEELTQTLPPFLARNIRGETDSELAFHLFLDSLFRDGTLNDLTLDTEVLAKHLRELVNRLDELHAEVSKEASFAIIVTNGQVMGSVNRGIAMHYSHREGIHTCSDHAESDHERLSHARYKGIMLGAQMLDPGHQWREISDGSLLTVSKGLELKVLQI